MKYTLFIILTLSLVLPVIGQNVGILLEDGSIDTLRKSRVHVQYRLEFCLKKCYQFVYIELPDNPTIERFKDSLYWVFKGANPSYSTEINPFVCFDNPIDVDTISINVPSFSYVSGQYFLGGEGYTHVTTIDCEPESAFASDRDTICEREGITFKDISESNPEYWTWHFEGGTPDTWQGPEPPEILYTQAGTYDVKLIVSNETGADTLIKSEFVTVLPNPVSVGSSIQEFSEMFGTEIILDACSEGEEYHWISAQNLSCYDCPDPVLKATQSETILLVVGDPDSPCHDSCFYKINVESVDEKIWFPDAFSPNNDGINDFFQSYGINVELTELRVYNRWGAQVFISNEEGWNGEFNGQPMEPGVYTYYAIYNKLYSGESDWVAGEVKLMR